MGIASFPPFFLTWISCTSTLNPQLKPLVKTIKTNLGNHIPKRISADAGYFSEDNCKFLDSEKIQAYIATEKTNQLSKTARNFLSSIPSLR